MLPSFEGQASISANEMAPLKSSAGELAKMCGSRQKAKKQKVDHRDEERMECLHSIQLDRHCRAAFTRQRSRDVRLCLGFLRDISDFEALGP